MENYSLPVLKEQIRQSDKLFNLFQVLRAHSNLSAEEQANCACSLLSIFPLFTCNSTQLEDVHLWTDDKKTERSDALRAWQVKMDEFGLNIHHLDDEEKHKIVFNPNAFLLALYHGTKLPVPKVAWKNRPCAQCKSTFPKDPLLSPLCETCKTKKGENPAKKQRIERFNRRVSSSISAARAFNRLASFSAQKPSIA